MENKPKMTWQNWLAVAFIVMMILMTLSQMPQKSFHTEAKDKGVVPCAAHTSCFKPVK